MNIRIYVFVLTTITSLSFSQKAVSQITIAFDSESDQVFHGVESMRSVLVRDGERVTFSSVFSKTIEKTIRIVSNPEDLETLYQQIDEIVPGKIKNEGFQILAKPDRNTLYIAARDGTGAMYGLNEVRDYYKSKGTLFDSEASLNNPHFEYRIIKFNLPWSPYRDNPATRIHTETCRDLQFWEDFLNMMADNRFNVLSLWNLHPFPFMIRAKNFPGATPFSEKELSEWQNFWKSLFRMAKNRGIQTFIVNWNIVVSPEFTEAYGGTVFNDQSELVKKYTRESVTQMINEY